jgi:hypothetical protein
MSAPQSKTPLLDKLRGWLKPTPPTPAPTPTPVPAQPPGPLVYMRIWALLRAVNFQELWPVLVSVPVLVFFALSGLVAWLVLAVRFLYTIWRVLP